MLLGVVLCVPVKIGKQLLELRVHMSDVTGGERAGWVRQCAGLRRAKLDIAADAGRLPVSGGEVNV